jgi:hypothetical protein
MKVAVWTDLSKRQTRPIQHLQVSSQSSPSQQVQTQFLPQRPPNREYALASTLRIPARMLSYSHQASGSSLPASRAPSREAVSQVPLAEEQIMLS